MKNIFVLAWDDFNGRLLRTIRNAERYRFHSLLNTEELVAAKRYDMPALIEKAQGVLRDFEGSVDGIIAYWDFPSTTMAPILRRAVGLEGPSFESLLRCEHKFWSRRVQREIVPELVPDFALVDPFAQNAQDRPPLAFPFWIKPVKAHSSHLGFLIRDEGDYRQALGQIRQRLHRFAEPFNHLLTYADLPPEIAAADGFHCIAEEIISAPRQCTLEGYVWRGEPQIYGIVDSLREAGQSSFTRYQYPTLLPEPLQRRMIEVAGKVMRHVGLDGGPFNMEFFHDPQTDRLWLLEINPRISKSHCPLFYDVDGASHHQVAVRLATAEPPEFPHREGRFPMAAKFMLRRSHDARVTSVPGAEEIERTEREVPGTMVKLDVSAGDRLSHLEDQDSYSYEYAVVFVGGEDQDDLERKYRRVREILPFGFEDLPKAEGERAL